MAGQLTRGTMINTLKDLLIIKQFGLMCKPPKAPRIVEVICYPPLYGWVKCNMDGLSKGSSGIAGCGGIF